MPYTNVDIIQLPVQLVMPLQLRQRSITGSGALPLQSTDAILNVDINSPLTITVPLANTRNGVPFTFKNLAASSASLTLVASRSYAIVGEPPAPVPRPHNATEPPPDADFRRRLRPRPQSPRCARRRRRDAGRRRRSHGARIVPGPGAAGI